MILNRKRLPEVIPIALDIDVATKCSNLHFEYTNLRRTMELYCETSGNSFEPARDDGCHVKINISVPNMPASFHIGLGDSFVNDHGEHQHMWYTVTDKNLSHYLSYIRIGELDQVTPLDDTALVLSKPVPYMVTYNLELVPTLTDVGLGYQIMGSVAKSNLEKIRSKGIPGIIFQWSFSPVGMEKSQARKPLIELVAHLLAVVGCFFVFVRFLDSFIFWLEWCCRAKEV
jgi:hypothetical protein